MRFEYRNCEIWLLNAIRREEIKFHPLFEEFTVEFISFLIFMYLRFRYFIFYLLS